MSYALDFAPEARAAWLGLEVVVQEAVLDEIDRLADNPFSLPRGLSVRDVIHESAGVRHYVFIQLATNHARRTVHVYAMGHYAKPLTAR